MNARTLIATTLLLLATGQAAATDAPTADSPRYSVMLRPDALAIPAGHDGRATMLVGSGAPATVLLGADAPAGFRVSFSNDTVTLPAKPANVSVKIDVAPTVAPGAYKIAIHTRALERNESHDVALTVKVPPAARPTPSASASSSPGPRETVIDLDALLAKLGSGDLVLKLTQDGQPIRIVIHLERHAEKIDQKMAQA